MRMLNISSVDDLIVNSMHILEPAVVDCDGKHREDGTVFLSLLIYFLVPNVKISFTICFGCSSLSYLRSLYMVHLHEIYLHYLCQMLVCPFELSLFLIVHQYDKATRSH